MGALSVRGLFAALVLASLSDALAGMVVVDGEDERVRNGPGLIRLISARPKGELHVCLSNGIGLRFGLLISNCTATTTSKHLDVVVRPYHT